MRRVRCDVREERLAGYHSGGFFDPRGGGVADERGFVPVRKRHPGEVEDAVISGRFLVPDRQTAKI